MTTYVRSISTSPPSVLRTATPARRHGALCADRRWITPSLTNADHGPRSDEPRRTDHTGRSTPDHPRDGRGDHAHHCRPNTGDHHTSRVDDSPNDNDNDNDRSGTCNHSTRFHHDNAGDHDTDNHDTHDTDNDRSGGPRGRWYRTGRFGAQER